MNNRSSFITELKRRNVIRLAGLYLVGAWLLVQVASAVLPMFGVPDWLPRSIVMLLAIGFIPVVIFGWVFELTPQGLKRDDEVPRVQSIAPQTGRRIDRMIIVVLDPRWLPLLRKIGLASRAAFQNTVYRQSAAVSNHTKQLRLGAKSAVPATSLIARFRDE